MENDSQGKIPEDSILEGVVKSLDDNVPTFEGRLRTEQETLEHLAQT